MTRTREAEIERASVHHLYQYDYSYEEGEHLDFYIKGFIEGAKWADTHPVIWHDVSEEEPKKEEFILVEVIDTLTPNSEIGYYVEYVSEWLLDSMKTEGFKCRWAYISDLLPKGDKK